MTRAKLVGPSAPIRSPRPFPRKRGELPRTRTRTLTILEPSQASQPALSAGDSGYRRIRSDIIFGALNPSGRLKLESMKEEYGLSVSTLREILNRLASEGFVVAEGQRGFEVA